MYLTAIIVIKHKIIIIRVLVKFWLQKKDRYINALQKIRNVLMTFYITKGYYDFNKRLLICYLVWKTND